MSQLSYYPPKGEYISFESEEDYAERGRGWGLFGKTAKKQFWYKNGASQSLVVIKGYEHYRNLNILVVEFEDGSLSCIHPSYLKEMQSGTFGKETAADEAEGIDVGIHSDAEAEAPKKKAAGEKSTKIEKAAKAEKAPKKQAEKKEKLELPVDKVKFTAKVKQFTTKPNPFSDNDDEILLLEEVAVLGDSPLVLGDAWCGYSNTLKSFGLEIGDVLSFEGKVVDKKFNKEILYKVNNPSKLTKA